MFFFLFVDSFIVPLFVCLFIHSFIYLSIYLCKYLNLFNLKYSSYYYYVQPQSREDELPLKTQILTELQSVAVRLQQTLPAVLRSGVAAAARAVALQQGQTPSCQL
jgi:hypothetical protein